MSYRLAAFDIDGTLVGSSGELSPATIAALRSLTAAGVAVAAATTRPYEIATPMFAALGLDIAVIASAGADVRLAGGAVCDQSDWGHHRRHGRWRLPLCARGAHIGRLSHAG